MCRFVGCGRNERFNYVVMELQVSPSIDVVTLLFLPKLLAKEIVNTNKIIPGKIKVKMIILLYFCVVLLFFYFLF